MTTSYDYVPYGEFFGYFHFPNASFSVAFFLPVGNAAVNVTQTSSTNPISTGAAHSRYKRTTVVFFRLSSGDSYISAASWKLRVCCCRLSKNSTPVPRRTQKTGYFIEPSNAAGRGQLNLLRVHSCYSAEKKTLPQTFPPFYPVCPLAFNHT